MILFKNICFSIFLMFLFSCSQEETAHPPGGSPSDFPEGGGIGDTQIHAVVPIELSPQDKEKARMAPDGKVFIKGGCFIMGNDFAQTDEAPEHEVCVDNFFMDKYEVTNSDYLECFSEGVCNPNDLHETRPKILMGKTNQSYLFHGKTHKLFANGVVETFLLKHNGNELPKEIIWAVLTFNRNTIQVLPMM